MVQINFTILANVLSFAVLLWLIVKFGTRPVLNLLDERAEKIKESLTKTKEAELEIQKMKEDYSQKIKAVLEEAQQVRTDARKLAEEEKTKIIEEAKKNAEYLELKAKKNIEIEYENAKKYLEREILKYSVQIAEKIVGREINADVHRELIETSINEIGG